ncbi:MAG: hypothetical protein M1834_001095 [Cirrosporium novae-zelandiae]|nr:MAG: hypothetical protein M1834_001095 [Cirrosporium novae-zelandiae]
MTLDTFFQDSHIFHRSLAHKPLNVVSGSGLTLTLDSGKQLIDATGGPAVACLGHGRADVADAVSHQIKQLAYLFSAGGYSNDATEELASIVLKNNPGGLSKAIFVNSGSEATDTSIKLVTQYWQEKGEYQRRNFIARKQSYHGNTIGALCVSGHDSRRNMYKDWISNNVTFVDPCYAYRCKHNGETDEKYVARLRQQLEDEFQRLGPDTVAAFYAETIVGSTLGCLPAVKGYFKAVRAVCDKYGALLVLDEIMCGMGKTGTMHAWEQEDIRGPDIETVGKALGGGFVPLSGVLVHQKIFDVIANGSKGLAHGHTFQAHPAACAGALAVQKIIARDNILENVRRMGALLEKLLKEHIAPLPYVGNVRGRGLFWGVEFMKDKESKTPFPPKDSFGHKVREAGLDLGVNVLEPMGASGALSVETVIVCPPYIVTEKELVKIINLLKQAIEKVSAGYRD